MNIYVFIIFTAVLSWIWKMACSCAMKCRCDTNQKPVLHLSFIQCSWGQTWKLNKTNGSRIIFQLTMSGPYFPARSALYCPLIFNFGRLIYPKTATSACMDHSWICWSFSGITFVRKMLKSTKRIGRRDVLLKPLVLHCASTSLTLQMFSSLSDGSSHLSFSGLMRMKTLP